jgi:pimeloyl-ACP methyl ester carboxylesterase
MGCGESKPQTVQVTAKKPATCGPNVAMKETGAWPRPAYDHSRIFAPKGTSAHSLPALVMVHGAARNDGEGGAPPEELLGVPSVSWEMMQPLAEKMVGEGFIVLIIGLRDDALDVTLADYPELDEEAKVTARDFAHSGKNVWPSKYYGKALSAAIDHLCAVAPKAHGVKVDAQRVGLVGHSIGGAGVLHAAASECADRVRAVVALNPVHHSVRKPFDHLREIKRYLSGEKHSGEHGNGELPHLKRIKCATLVYGSQAEYNTSVLETPWTGDLQPYALVWPKPSSIHAQVGAASKELYVDNTTDVQNFVAHGWLATGKGLEQFGGGAPLRLIGSFLRRHLAGDDEAPPERPENAKEWAVEGGAKV